MSENSQINYSKYFKHILPLSVHSSYSRDLEFSDKIIVPRSVSKDFLRSKVPFPPQLILIPERSFNNSIHCSVLEFTAEEDFVYIPFWMFRELGFKVMSTEKGIKRPFKAGYGITMQVMPIVSLNNSLTYTILRCKSIEVFCPSELASETIKNEVQKYFFIREKSEVSICAESNIHIIKIVKVHPGPIAVIKGEFKLVRLAEMPHAEKGIVEESTSTCNFEEKNENFPTFHEKLPKFLIEILKKKELMQKTESFQNTLAKIKHKKNLTYAPVESPNLFKPIETPDLEKYNPSKNVEVGKSLEESLINLPPVYNSPIRLRMHSPQLLTITIPELNQPFTLKKKFTKTPIWYKQQKKRSATPLTLKKAKIEGIQELNNGNTYKNQKIVKLFKMI